MYMYTFNNYESKYKRVTKHFRVVEGNHIYNNFCKIEIYNICLYEKLT